MEVEERVEPRHRGDVGHDAVEQRGGVLPADHLGEVDERPRAQRLVPDVLHLAPAEQGLLEVNDPAEEQLRFELAAHGRVRLGV